MRPGISIILSLADRRRLRPHRVRQCKLSNDPDFVAKLRDVVGLYVDPPAHAIVLSVDEMSQIQALDRTQPGRPMKKGRLGTMTHDYKRHGTTTLFAALNVLEGKVIGRCMQPERVHGVHAKIDDARHRAGGHDVIIDRGHEFERQVQFPAQFADVVDPDRQARREADGDRASHEPGEGRVRELGLGDLGEQLARLRAGDDQGAVTTGDVT